MEVFVLVIQGAEELDPVLCLYATRAEAVDNARDTFIDYGGSLLAWDSFVKDGRAYWVFDMGKSILVRIYVLQVPK